MVVESPLSHARVVLEHAVAARIVHELARPLTPLALTDGIAVQVLTLLLNAGMLTVQTEDASSEDQDSPLRWWEFHDLLFHARSRIGRHDQPVGARSRPDARGQPAPLKPRGPGERIDLYRPDLEGLMRDDPPFALVQETRRSVREYGESPVALRDIGEFLFRVGRVTRTQSVEMETAEGSIALEVASRPYPAGGALYELELYVAVNASEGLPAGLYRYLPLDHQLERICGRTAEIDRLLADASRATRVAFDQLQVLIVIGARFQRLSWKYRSIAYAATLKHVGVLYQTMYLVATAMRLAPCAIGVGDSDLFARAAGTNYYEETSVGEFLLGSTRPSAGAASVDS
jgi:SagB-type dehydrogenase family enzyme